MSGEVIATPLVEQLARHFRDRVGGPALVVEAPLALSGARRALQEGELDGVLLARAADAPPVTHGVPIARTRPLWVAGSAQPLRSLGPAALAAGLLGLLVDRQGQPVTFEPVDLADPRLLAFAGTPEVLAAMRALGARTALWRRAGGEGRTSGRLAPQSVALADTGLLALQGAPVWPIRYTAPVPALELWIVHRGDPPPHLQAFLAFCRSSAGRELITDLGYDLPRGGP